MNKIFDEYARQCNQKLAGNVATMPNLMGRIVVFSLHLTFYVEFELPISVFEFFPWKDLFDESWMYIDIDGYKLS